MTGENEALIELLQDQQVIQGKRKPSAWVLREDPFWRVLKHLGLNVRLRNLTVALWDAWNDGFVNSLDPSAFITYARDQINTFNAHMLRQSHLN